MKKCIYIYNTDKNKLFSQLVLAMAVLKGYVNLQVLKDIWRHFTTDVSYFKPYAEIKNNEGEKKVCMKWILFKSWFRPGGAKVSSFIIQKFSRYFSLSFNVSVS